MEAMKEDRHQRAQRLILEVRLAEIPEADQVWLAKHLEECAACAVRADSIDAALQTLRTLPVYLSPDLVAATHYRVHRRAHELRQSRSPQLLFWLASGLSFVWMIASTPYVWRGMEWISGLLGIPRVVWQAGFGLWWLLPALALAAMLSELSAGRNEQEEPAIPIRSFK
jgi:anti-sigma factor RsiW